MASEPFPWREFADAMEAFKREQQAENASEPFPDKSPRESIQEYLEARSRTVRIERTVDSIKNDIDELMALGADEAIAELQDYLAIARKREAA